MSVKISLVIPGLCGPIPEIDETHPAASDLLKLLKPARATSTSMTGFANQLAKLFDINTSGKIPHAALSLEGVGIDPGEACWVRADPVNLQADMDRAILSDGQSLNLRTDEAEKLVDELNQHLAEDGLSVLLADSNNWFIKLDDCEFTTTPLHDAAGRNINHLLPEGKSAGYWKSLLNEIQMLLHMSSVNTAREQRGQAAINSIWLWGEGCLPAKGNPDITRVWTDDMLTAGMARLHDISFTALTDVNELANHMNPGTHSLITFEQLNQPACYGDAPAWHNALGDLVNVWLLPIVELARAGKASLDVYPCNGIKYRLLPSAINLQFWKKARLQDYVET